MVSIIIPVYNGEKYLSRCLGSIEKQTYQNFECIIVDDGSTDTTAQICEPYFKRDSRFIYYYKENAGVSSARNFGIDKSHGEYISFVDADDYIGELYLEKLISALLETEADIAYCHAYDVYANGEIIKNDAENLQENGGDYCLITPAQYSWTDYNNGHFTVWGGVLKRKLIDSDTYFPTDLTVGEDTFFLAQIIKKSNNICSLNESLYYYSFVENSVYHSEFSEKRYDEIIAWERICEVFDYKNKSAIAYAQRMQLIWKKYRKSYAFNKKIMKDLYDRYKKIGRNLMPYYISNKRFLNAIKTLTYIFLFKMYALFIKK